MSLCFNLDQSKIVSSGNGLKSHHPPKVNNADVKISSISLRNELLQLNTSRSTLLPGNYTSALIVRVG